MKFKAPNRRSTLVCRESYQDLPTPALASYTLPYCGKGRRDCATVAPVPQSVLNPDQGATTPAALAAAEPTCEFNKVRPEAVNGLRFAGSLVKSIWLYASKLD